MFHLMSKSTGVKQWKFRPFSSEEICDSANKNIRRKNSVDIFCSAHNQPEDSLLGLFKILPGTSGLQAITPWSTYSGFIS